MKILSPRISQSEKVNAFRLDRILIPALFALFLAAGCAREEKQEATNAGSTPATSEVQATPVGPFQANVVQDTRDNTNFRKVLFTGKNSQLVAMSIPPKGEIGKETHAHVEQTIFILSGTGSATMAGKTTAVKDGDVLGATPGTEHNVVNTGTTDLKVYTIYTPPNHIDGRVHATKADADGDKEDEAFGEKVQ